MHIIVASKNPVKVASVRKGFEEMFPSINLDIIGVETFSGVADQPLDNETTLMGAITRAKNAKDNHRNADYWVGIEGGIEKLGNEMSAFAWIVIHSANQTGKARTGTFYLPDKVTELIEGGKELGEADDIVFGHTNSKQKTGAVGILTNNIIDRTALYAQAVILALIPFKNKQIY